MHVLMFLAEHAEENGDGTFSATRGGLRTFAAPPPGKVQGVFVVIQLVAENFDVGGHEMVLRTQGPDGDRVVEDATHSFEFTQAGHKAVIVGPAAVGLPPGEYTALLLIDGEFGASYAFEMV